MSETVSFKCPSCGSPLKYSAERQRFSCEYCNSDFDFDTVQNADVNADTEFDWGDYKENISGEALEGTVSYICKSCGAEIVTDATTAASICPYCESTIVMEENVSGLIKPNGIIPFRVDKKQLKDIVANYCKGHRLLPRNFITDQKIESIQGMYVPFWLYDCHTDGTMGFRGTRVRTWSDARYRYTETSYYYVECEGEMSFSRVPVDGSFRMGDPLMDSLEPFDFSDMQEFAYGYLSGFVADRFDQDADTCLPRASSRIKSSVATAFTQAVRGSYATLTPSRSRIGLDQTHVNYVLLPVYFITTSFQGEKYEYAVNGQTGKMVGQLPVDQRRSLAYWIGIAAGVSAAALAVATFIL